MFVVFALTAAKSDCLRTVSASSVSSNSQHSSSAAKCSLNLHPQFQSAAAVAVASEPSETTLTTSQAAVKKPTRTSSFLHTSHQAHTNNSNNNNDRKRIEKRLADPDFVAFLVVDDVQQMAPFVSNINNSSNSNGSKSDDSAHALFASSFALFGADEMRLLLDTLASRLKPAGVASPSSPCTQQRCNIACNIILFGNDQLLNKYAQAYVEASANVPQLDASGLVRLHFVPRGGPDGAASILATHLCRVSATYKSLFGDESAWPLHNASARNNNNNTCSSSDPIELLTNHLLAYANCSSGAYLLPLHIGEIMINKHDKDDESTPKFIPFLCDVRVGFPTTTTTTSNTNDITSTTQLDGVEGNAAAAAAGSGGANGSFVASNRISMYNLDTALALPLTSSSNNSNSQRSSPPNSPSTASPSQNAAAVASSTTPTGLPLHQLSTATAAADECGYNLQLDYWTSSQSSSSSSSLTVASSASSASSPLLAASAHHHHLSPAAATATSAAAAAAAAHHHHHHQPEAKTSKSSTKALFKSLHIYRSLLVAKTAHSATTNATASNNGSSSSMQQMSDALLMLNNYLTLIYVIKDKKPKSKHSTLFVVVVVFLLV